MMINTSVEVGRCHWDRASSIVSANSHHSIQTTLHICVPIIALIATLPPIY